ncbi:MAG: Rieske 2Fe-2S domain-containing protein [Planctomycetaceae bacterium]
MANPVELWKAEKHGFDVWNDVLEYAASKTPMNQIDEADLERMKWHGFYYRRRDEPGRYMNRIRITGNELTAEQARAVAHIAYEFGHGIVDVTTRANLQIQGIDIENVPKTTQRLERVGLTSRQTGHDNIRNVFCHQFSGVDPEEIVDTRSLCHEIDAVFMGSRVYSDLPRKFNIALNGTDRHGAHFWTQDLSFLATRDADGDPAFHLLVGGTQGQSTHLAWHLPVLVRPEQVTEVTRVLLDLFREKGTRDRRNQARFRYVVESLGISGVLAWIEDRLPFRLMPFAREPIPASTPEELVGWFRQSAAKKWAMALCVPLGRLSWQQLEGLAVLATRWADGQLRTSADQGIAVINIPTGYKNAAATEAAALGLSVYSDAIARNTVACTGQQFCNIAVTETKGHMFQLMERLRQKRVTLHGIRIHMSGCPSSCAGHFTADIGLKGVRVRRLLGTREGFDVMLGGGLAGQVHLALPYKLGVDVDQLPNLIEEVVREYYLQHRSGQTFSAYWREKLQAKQADKVGEHDFTPPVWVCENCDFHHSGEDPPVFCPKCAGLRRYFARIADGPSAAAAGPGAVASSVGQPSAASQASVDGFVFAVALSELKPGIGRQVTVAGREIALFLDGDQVHAIDNACPHEGAPLAEGDFSEGVVTCSWHAWTFKACTGCSLDPQGHQVATYVARVENGQVQVQIVAPTAPLPVAATGPLTKPRASSFETIGTAAAKSACAVEVERTIVEIVDETPNVKTFRLDNSDGAVPFDHPGKFVKVCVLVDGREHWRSFTISSSPSRSDRLDLTIKLNPHGVVSRFLFDRALGTRVRIKGTQGAFFFDPQRHPEPLILISAGSGITPMMSILRFLIDQRIERECVFLHGARTAADIIFARQCASIAAESSWLKYVVTLSRPPEGWAGRVGRLSPEWLAEYVADVARARAFLCGPNDFMECLGTALRAAGMPAERIHTEQFHNAPARAAPS